MFSLFQASTDENDGINQKTQLKYVSQNSTLPMNLTFNIPDVSAFTEYSVHAVANYIESECTNNSYPGISVVTKTDRK